MTDALDPKANPKVENPASHFDNPKDVVEHRTDPRPLLRAGTRDQIGWGGQHDLDQRVARHVQR